MKYSKIVQYFCLTKCPDKQLVPLHIYAGRGTSYIGRRFCKACCCSNLLCLITMSVLVMVSYIAEILWELKEYKHYSKALVQTLSVWHQQGISVVFLNYWYSSAKEIKKWTCLFSVAS